MRGRCTLTVPKFFKPGSSRSVPSPGISSGRRVSRHRGQQRQVAMVTQWLAMVRLELHPTHTQNIAKNALKTIQQMDK